MCMVVLVAVVMGESFCFLFQILMFLHIAQYNHHKYYLPNIITTHRGLTLRSRFENFHTNIKVFAYL